MPDDHSPQPQGRQNGSSTHHSASQKQQMQDFVETLAHYSQAIATAAKGNPGSNLREVASQRHLPGHDLRLYKSWLAEAHRFFREGSQQNVALTYASEWVLDNYYIIRQAIQQIEEDLPPGYYSQLPKLVDGPLKNLPRIYAIARAVLSYQHLLFDSIDLQTILIQFQELVPLTMGELWALPIFLRYSLIEFLAYDLLATIQPSDPPNLPAPVPSLLANENFLTASEGGSEDNADEDRVANIILSLRAIAEQNWNDFFEAVSCVERTLRQDPSGIYPRMDFKTRDLYRKEIENLSFAAGRDEYELAEIILSLADSTSTGLSPHFGDYLFGKGRAALEQRIGYRPDGKIALKRWIFSHPSAVYFSGILVIIILVILALSFAARLPELFRIVPLSSASSPWDILRYSGSVPIQWIVVAILGIALMVSALTIATSLVNWLVTMIVQPRVLPKLNFKDQIPDEFKTLVVIPTLITSRKEIDSLANQLELHYLRNPEPGLLFALLTDFSDADHETLPDDEKLVQYALNTIENLNKKYACPALGQDVRNVLEEERVKSIFQKEAARFYFLHRKRLWNPSENSWMGWERKRGKLHELNLLLRGGKNLSFTTLEPYQGARWMHSNACASSSPSTQTLSFRLERRIVWLARSHTHSIGRFSMIKLGELCLAIPSYNLEWKSTRKVPIILGSRAFLQGMPGWICIHLLSLTPIRICSERAFMSAKAFMTLTPLSAASINISLKTAS